MYILYFNKTKVKKLKQNKNMKTQKKIFLTLVIFFIVGCIPQVSAAIIDTIYVTANTSTENHQICSSVNDSIMMHCPIGHTDIRWKDPSMQSIDGPDSVFVTNKNQGFWMFYSEELGVWKNIYVYLVSTPYEPASMINDTSICTTNFLIKLEAENPGSTYLWSTGVTTQWLDITTFGTYTLTVTNTCGTGVYSKTIAYSNPNAPHLGADQIFCLGSISTLDPGSTNVTSYQWSTGETTPTINVNTTGAYWVYVVDNNGCSGRDTVQITSLLPTPAPICYVEFDTITWKNNINWTANLPGNADSIHIYKEVSLNVWNRIGSVSKSISHFIDSLSAPQAQSYSYKIAVVDTCGNESNLSSYHTTITLLSAYDVGTNTYGFNWSAYHGLTVNDYYLFSIDASNVVNQIATVPGNVFMYNYLNPNLAYIKYFVGFETPDCDAKANVIVKSNWVQSVLTSVNELKTIPFSVYPNPASDQLTINIGIGQFQVEVSTMLGQVLLTEHNTKVLNISSLPQGMYIISITANGVKTNKLITKD